MKKIMYFIIPIFLFFCHYNIYRPNYSNHKDFINSNINSIIEKVEQNKGLRIYVDHKKYFYLANSIKIKPIAGDKILKKGNNYNLYRKFNDEYELIENLTLDDSYVSSYYCFYLNRVWGTNCKN